MHTDNPFDKLNHKLNQLIEQGELLMALVSDLTAAVAIVAADITKLATDVAALQAKGGISPSDLDPVLKALQGAATALSALDTSIQPAPPPPPPPPVSLIDVGSVNAVKTASVPPVTVQPAVGTSFTVSIGTTNTGPSTYDPGSGPLPVVSSSGAPLVGGELSGTKTFTMSAAANWTFV